MEKSVRFEIWNNSECLPYLICNDYKENHLSVMKSYTKILSEYRDQRTMVKTKIMLRGLMSHVRIILEFVDSRPNLLG